MYTYFTYLIVLHIYIYTQTYMRMHKYIFICLFYYWFLCVCVSSIINFTIKLCECFLQYVIWHETRPEWRRTNNVSRGTRIPRVYPGRWSVNTQYPWLWPVSLDSPLPGRWPETTPMTPVISESHEILAVGTGTYSGSEVLQPSNSEKVCNMSTALQGFWYIVANWGPRGFEFGWMHPSNSRPRE